MSFKHRKQCGTKWCWGIWRFPTWRDVVNAWRRAKLILKIPIQTIKALIYTVELWLTDYFLLNLVEYLVQHHVKLIDTNTWITRNVLVIIFKKAQATQVSLAVSYSIWLYSHILQSKNPSSICHFGNVSGIFHLKKHEYYYWKHFTNVFIPEYIIATELLYHTIMDYMGRYLMWYCTVCFIKNIHDNMHASFKRKMVKGLLHLKNASFLFQWKLRDNHFTGVFPRI